MYQKKLIQSKTQRGGVPSARTKEEKNNIETD